VRAKQAERGRGEHGEFGSLLPADADPHLNVQRVALSSPGGLHVDLHTEDVRALAARAEALGASATYLDAGCVVCESSWGVRFCVVDSPAAQAATPPPGRVDLPPSRWEGECRFWADLTGWELVVQKPADEFRRLRRPEGLAIQFLLQRLDDEQPVVVRHLDLGSDDYLAEADRHLGLGATEVRHTPHWVTLRDPSGRLYCVTRHPVGEPAVRPEPSGSGGPTSLCPDVNPFAPCVDGSRGLCVVVGYGLGSPSPTDGAPVVPHGDLETFHKEGS
jgi:hypothetical protein